MLIIFFVLQTYPKLYVFIVFIQLQANVVIKDQFSLDFKDFNWKYSQFGLKSPSGIGGVVIKRK